MSPPSVVRRVAASGLAGLASFATIIAAAHLLAPTVGAFTSLDHMRASFLIYTLLLAPVGLGIAAFQRGRDLWNDDRRNAAIGWYSASGISTIAVGGMSRGAGGLEWRWRAVRALAPGPCSGTMRT